MVDEERVIGLLDRIRRDRERLAAMAKRDLGEHGLDAVKHRFITVIEGCARVAHHLAVSEGWSVPETNADAFAELGRRHVIEGDLPRAMGAAAGFRNVLVHRYVEVEDDLVMANLGRLDDFDEFVSQVGGWVAEQRMPPSQ